MTDPLPFGSACPKCQFAARALRWCRGCDDGPDRDHLHAWCPGCGYRRIERAADDPANPPAAGPAAAIAPPPPPDEGAPTAVGGSA